MSEEEHDNKTLTLLKFFCGNYYTEYDVFGNETYFLINEPKKEDKMTKFQAKEKIKSIEYVYNVKVLYMTEVGSKLYGTDNENSDSDYKFIFVPTITDLILKQDLDHIRVGGQTNEKNTAVDMDLDGVSLHKFFQLLSKGETGGVDLLFSMWSKSVLYKDKKFVKTIQKNYREFLNKKLHSFVGYCVGQANKYGIKGSRYKELIHFNKALSTDGFKENEKLNELFKVFETYFDFNDTKYLKMTTAPGPKTGTNSPTFVVLKEVKNKYKNTKESLLDIEGVEVFSDYFFVNKYLKVYYKDIKGDYLDKLIITYNTKL